MQEITQATDGSMIGIDRKTFRGSYDSGSGKSAIHRVSASSSANGVVLGQEKTAGKSNEVTAISAWIKTSQSNLLNKTVMIDVH